MADQPLYALSRQVQLLIPGYGSDVYFAMMGGLHIEQVLLTIHSQLIEGSGLAEVVTVSDLSLKGAAHALSTAHSNDRTRYIIQVIVHVLSINCKCITPVLYNTCILYNV